MKNYKDKIKKIKKIQTKANFLIKDSLIGKYHSYFKGKGIEFAEVKEYLPGDDIKFIDWNVTARMNNTYLKTFHEERDLTIILLLDVSSSNNFGTSSCKIDLSAEFSAVISLLALSNNDKIGLISFSDKIESFIPPKKNKYHVWKIINEVLENRFFNKKTNISKALEYASKVIRKKAVVFLISDFIDNNYQKQLSALKNKFDLIAVHILDPFEENMNINTRNLLFNFKDLESSKELLFLSKNNYKDIINKKTYELKKFFEKNNIDYLKIYTNKDYTKELINLFSKRVLKR